MTLVGAKVKVKIKVLQRNIGCVEQSNDGLMEFRCCFFANVQLRKLYRKFLE